MNGGRAPEPTRVLVVDDHAAVRSGVEALLAGEPDLEAVGSASGAKEAIALARETRPHVAIVDFQLGDGDGLSLCRLLKELREPVRVVLYSAYADGPLALGGVIAGADGVVHKSALADELCATVRAVASGESAMPRSTPSAQAVVAARLDPEDLPILAMLLDGTEPDEIARVLGIRSEWLVARRWAMLERLRRMAGRHATPAAPRWSAGGLHA